MAGSETLKRVWDHITEHEEMYLRDLLNLIRQPSISSQGLGLEQCASLLRDMVVESGLKSEIIPAGDNPIVYGELISDPGLPTVLFYGHYDVQPPEPLDEWTSPPFEPEIRNGRIYARGSADNKGQLMAHLAAIRSFLDVTGRLPCNVKIMFEGQEEMASPHLSEFVERHKNKLAADMAYFSDGPIHESGRPLVTLGVRGILKVALSVRTANRDAHSGNRGGLMPNPNQVLARVLASLHDDRGRVSIEGFYDDVRPMTPLDREVMGRVPFDEEILKEEYGLPRFADPQDLSVLEKIMYYPTANIAGVQGGYTGKGFKTVIPATSVAKIDFRLVVDQDPDHIFDALVRHVASVSPEVKVDRLGHYHPSRTPLENPYTDLVMEAARLGWGDEPILLPSLGGSSPDAVFTKGLGIPSLLVPYGNYDEDNHAPNENLKLECWRKGMRTTAAFLELVGKV